MRIALRALVGTVLVGSTVVGCVPSGTGGGTTTTTRPPATTAAPTTAPPTAPPTTASTPSSPHAPAISAFAASATAGPSPLTVGLTWTISDPDSDPMTCRLDHDTNGSWDVTIGGCTSASSRTRSFTTPGTTTVVLQVSDGTNASTGTVQLVVGAASIDQYSVTLRLGGTMSGTQTAAFTSAAAKWASIVKTGQPDRPLNIAADYCVTGAPAFNGTVDDLLIDAQIVTIDGPGGILGQAGPCLVRSSNGIPLYGIMQFDSADVANLEASGQFANTIIHEMGHILGIGTIWTSKGVLNGAGTGNPTFTGPAAIGAWRELGGAGNVPVENSGGSGTVDSHWRETTFRTELMTGYLNSTNQLSFMTAASLADLGYGVDMSGADAYTLPSLRLGSVHADGELGHEHDHLLTVTPKGSV